MQKIVGGRGVRGGAKGCTEKVLTIVYCKKKEISTFGGLPPRLSYEIYNKIVFSTNV